MTAPNREPERIGKFRGTTPLTAGDLRTIVHKLNHLKYPDECPVEIRTPLPPKDRHIVDIHVLDYGTQPQGETP